MAPSPQKNDNSTQFQVSFVRYNPDVPQLVTSFKGYQKLMYKGYRYNIYQVRFVFSLNRGDWEKEGWEILLISLPP